MNWTSLKLKFPLEKNNIKKMRRQATNWEKVFAKTTFDKKTVTQNIGNITLKTQQENKEPTLQMDKRPKLRKIHR